ncbi:unnamed protein product [Pleuronectes platessa]|uniref:Uncharacterized protein n=1 Tax=Pleuronectes platessa TaxID=8262 RepID=A0A9N7VN02_PLEPL|nr:unnamed protein product [Pleuronectes platessa]
MVGGNQQSSKQALQLSTGTLKKAFTRVNTCKVAGPDNLPECDVQHCAEQTFTTPQSVRQQCPPAFHQSYAWRGKSHLDEQLPPRGSATGSSTSCQRSSKHRTLNPSQ